MNLARWILVFSLFSYNASVFAGARAGEEVSLSGSFDDDMYAAGGEVDSSARIRGDLVTAGGSLRLDGEIAGDVLAAGGELALLADVYDDARISGGDILVDSRIRDDLIAAGGRVRVMPDTLVGGDAWLAGGDVSFEGNLDGRLYASGGRVVIGGIIEGDIEIRAERVVILDSARIGGDLRYYSPQAARISDDAVIDGDVVHTEVEIPAGPVIAGVLLAGLFAWLTLSITAIALYLLFRPVAESTANITRERFWATAGLGLAVFAATPVVIIVLLSTGVGSLLAIILLLVYVLLLLTGYITGAYYVAERLHTRSGNEPGSRVVVSLWLAGSLLLLGIIGLIPVIGFIVGLLVLSIGIGSLARLLFDTKRTAQDKQLQGT